MRRFNAFIYLKMRIAVVQLQWAATRPSWTTGSEDGVVRGQALCRGSGSRMNCFIFYSRCRGFICAVSLLSQRIPYSVPQLPQHPRSTRSLLSRSAVSAAYLPMVARLALVSLPSSTRFSTWVCRTLIGVSAQRC